MHQARVIGVWLAVATAIILPLAVAASSPLLAWRDPVYIAAGFAGIAALALLLIQPLLAGGYLPGLSIKRGRRVHRWVGASLVLSVLFHVGGLWVTSPPDVIDALLLVSPTPFSVWGVLAMWAIFATALIALLRRRLRLAPRTWRRLHKTFAAVIVSGTVLHVALIEGTMGTFSKLALCGLVLLLTLAVILRGPGQEKRKRQRS